MSVIFKTLLSIMGSILTGLAVIASLLAIGRTQGKKQEKQENIEEHLRVAHETKKQTDAVDCMSDADIRERLHEFTRD